LQLDEKAFQKRLLFELNQVRREAPTFRPCGDLTEWIGYIMGTGPYEGGIFVFRIKIPRTYPFTPPIVEALTPIFHPNISESGKVCLDVFQKKWLTSMSLVDVINSLRLIFNIELANPDNYFNFRAATTLKRSKQEFIKIAQEWTKKFATWEKARELGIK